MKLEKENIARIGFIAVCVFLVCAGIAYKLFAIQFNAEQEIENKTEKLTRWKSVPADRGNIYAADGSLLATTLPRYDIRMDFLADGLTDEVFHGQVDDLALSMSQFFGKSPEGWHNNFMTYREEGQRYKLLKRSVSYKDLQVIKKFPLFERGRFKGGFMTDKKVSRENPFGEKARRTIGKYSVGKEKGIYGLELAFDSILRGIEGNRLQKKIATGDWMPINDEDEILPRDGADIYTTIDINIQDILDNALRKRMISNAAAYGCAVIMEVETGHIRGIVNLDRTENGIYKEELNHIVGTATEPGSTMKLPALLAALESGAVTIDQMVDTEQGRKRYYDRWMHDSNHQGYGKVTVQKAFEVSSNVGISKVVYEAFKKDQNAFIQALRKMGLNQKTGIDIPGEPAPFIKSPENKDTWYGTSLPWMSIGYELTMTPLQTLTFYNAIANNGVMVKPQIVQEIRQSEESVFTVETEVINKNFISENTLKNAQTLLEGVVEQGTASNLRSPHFKIAGKTGTAQVAVGGKYRNDDNVVYQASFVGYFPAEKPKYSCIVLVNNPTEGHYYGNRVAGPVFLEIAEKIYAKEFAAQLALSSKKQLAPVTKDGNASDLVSVCHALDINNNIGDETWTRTKAKEEIIESNPMKIEETRVPEVRGMPMMDAISLLENMGLKVNYEGNGLVKSQSKKRGEIFKQSEEITLVLEN